MTLWSYLTPAELVEKWPNASEYSEAQVTGSLKDSYSLVNSYINSSVKVPAYIDNGDIPAILKVAQMNFTMYLLERGNVGFTDENQALFDSTAAFLKKITQNEILISEIQKTTFDIGWSIKESTLTSGSIYVSGDPPTYNKTYTLNNTTSGWSYSPTFEVTASDGTYTSVSPTEEGVYLGDSNLFIQCDGEFSHSEYVIIKGVPYTRNVVSSKPTIQSSDIIY